MTHRLTGTAYGLEPDTKASADWRHAAICRDEDSELFFPIGKSGPAILQVEQAKAVCRRCPVTDACLKWALQTGQEFGVWGGLSEEERHPDAAKRAKATWTMRGKVPQVPRTHCPHDHEYTEENTYLGPDGKRRCRACATAQKAKYRLGEKARCHGCGFNRKLTGNLCGSCCRRIARAAQILGAR